MGLISRLRQRSAEPATILGQSPLHKSHNPGKASSNPSMTKKIAIVSAISMMLCPPICWKRSQLADLLFAVSFYEARQRSVNCSSALESDELRGRRVREDPRSPIVRDRVQS